MDNKYEIYDNVKFNYHYPYSWKKRNIKYLGGNVHYFIPDRENEGHGFDKKALIKLMTTVKPKVIISTNEGNQQE